MEFITRSIARLGGRHSTGAGSPDKHLPKIAAHDAEAAITAALPPSTWDALPQGWEVVIDPTDPHNIYYWNQQTDATTWHKPEHAAAEDVERDRFLYEEEEKEEALRFKRAVGAAVDSLETPTSADAVKEKKKTVVVMTPSEMEMHMSPELASKPSAGKPRPLPNDFSFALNTAAGGNQQVVWPPPPHGGAVPGARRLQDLVRNVHRGNVAANAIFDRLGKPTTAPPPPLTVKQRVEQLAEQVRGNQAGSSVEGEFDETLWQFQQGNWKHLPAPPKVKREEWKLRSVQMSEVGGPQPRRLNAATASSSGGAGGSVERNLQADLEAAGNRPLLHSQSASSNSGAADAEHTAMRYHTYPRILQ